GGGNDSISGGDGNDLVYDQAAGNDTLDGGAGDDFVSGNWLSKMIGGTGTDDFYLNLAASSINYNVNLNTQLTSTLVFDFNTSLTGFESGALHFGSGNDVVQLADNARISVFTGEGGDYAAGGKLSDYIEGEGGNDTLSAGLNGKDGIDTVKGGDGDDAIEGDAKDKLYGGAGTDTYYLSIGYTTAAVNLTLTNLGSVDAVFADGTVLSGFEGGGAIYLGSGSDKVSDLSAARDYFYGGKGDDTLAASGNGSFLDGGDGADMLIGKAGAQLDGGAGIDRFDLNLQSSAVGVTASLGGLASGAKLLGAASLARLESGRIYLGSGADNVSLGVDATITLDGGYGNDTLTGAGLGDVLRGAAGQDSLLGGGGDDDLDGGLGNDTINGGAGDDAVHFYNAPAGLNVSMVTGVVTCGAETDTLINIELVYGGVFNDTMTGSNGVNSLSGGNGDDHVYGGGGDDVLWGDTGDDTVDGGAGSDVMFGFDQDDYLIGGAGDTMDGGEGLDRLSLDLSTVALDITFDLTQADALALTGGPAFTVQAEVLDFETGYISLGSGSDTVKFNQAYTIAGGAGADAITGSGPVNQNISGDGGNDTLFSSSSLACSMRGGDGNDLITGGSDGDSIEGNDGADTITARGGNDSMAGGLGADVFVFNNKGESDNGKPDTIYDLSNVDTIDLSGIDANAGAAGEGAFTLVSAFTNTKGELMLSYDAVHDITSVLADITGDGLADMTIYLTGDKHAFTNFVL
ncbi:MAG: calcium-binding protein, partial [Caulobacteraceae bacterium]